MASNNVERCEICERDGITLKRSHDHVCCSSCAVAWAYINTRPEATVRLMRKIHGERYFPGGGAGRDQELSYLHDVLWRTNQALGGGVNADDLPGVIEELVKKKAVVDERVVCLAAEVANYKGVVGQLERDLAQAMEASAASSCELMANEVAVADQPDHADRYQVPGGYEKLMAVFVAAMDQAANGKGKERHATPLPFELQPTVCDARELGIGFPIGQARKKALESIRLKGRHRLNELLGAMVYLAMAYIVEMDGAGRGLSGIAGGLGVPVEAVALDFAKVGHFEGAGHD